METEYLLDEEFGERLLISVKADKSELDSNIRAARAILCSYYEVSIRINSHTYAFGHKNPEYTICEELGDRKGVMSERGITAGFKSAKKQGCKIADFTSNIITDCYVVFCGKAVRVNARIRQEKRLRVNWKH